MDINKISTKELIQELDRRKEKDGTGILNSEANKKILDKLGVNPNLSIGVVMTLGYPEEITEKTHKCSRCMNIKSYNHFSYYMSRVDANGYLMRSNAICDTCGKESNKKRTKILKDANQNGDIPKKPKKGSVCPGCNREWYGNWHRHHDDDSETFVSWLCGHCNMSLSEQRGIYVKTA